jgi:hypothetical protein
VLNGTTATYTAGSVGIGTNNTAGTALAVGTGATDTTSVLMFNSSDTSSNTNKIIFTYVQNGSRIGHSAGWNVNMYAGQSNNNIANGEGNFRFFMPTGVVNGGYHQRVNFAGTGNVGIGSTVPAFTLDVATGNGDVNFNGTLYQNKTNVLVYNTGVINSNALPVVPGLTSGQYGSSIAVPRVTVDTKGRITAIATQNLANVAATGDYNSLSNITFTLTSTSNATYTITNGNVGIGTSSPKAKLHVDTAIGNEILRISNSLDNGINIVTSDANASGAADYIRFGCKPAYAGGVAGGNYEPFITIVNTASRTYADIALVENGGNVGIGTTAVSDAKLRVQGDINVTGAIRQNGTQIVSNAGVISAAALPIVSGLTDGASFGNASNVATFTIDDKGRLATVANVAINNIPAANITSLCNVAKTANYVDLSNVPFVKSGNDAYYDYNGNVGIGYANPGYKLAVNGSIYCDSTLFTSNITVLGDVTVLNTTTSNTEQMYITNDGTGPAMYVKQTGQQPVAEFWDDNTIALTIIDGGNVGLGTTNPLYKLHVNGTANIGGDLSQNGVVICSGGVLSTSVFPTSGATAGTYGSINSTTATVPKLTVDTYGRVTVATTESLSLAPSATVDATNANNIGIGTFLPARLPIVSGVVGTYGSINSSTATVPKLTVDTYGRVTVATTESLSLAPSATIDATNANNIGIGTFLPARLPIVSGVIGTYGTSSNIPVIQVDTYGRVTSISTSATIDYNDLSNKIFTASGGGNASYALNGSVGIGTATPLSKVHVDGTVRATAFIGDGSQLTGIMSAASTVSSQWQDSNVGASSNIYYDKGRVGIGTSSPKYMCHVVGDVYAYNVITYSDEKYKYDVATIDGALDKVNSIRGVSYKLSGGPDDRNYIGVIAQEVEKHVPQVVYTDDSGLKSVSYGNMVGLFIEAFKDLTKKMSEQSSRIEKLERQLLGLGLGPCNT